MYLIPEIETVVILTPRTGSGSLRRAIAKRYPQAMMIYRHMEADGVPQGYDRWRKVGVVRDPAERLMSLYRYLQRFDGDHCPDYIQAMRASVRRPFDDWLLNNEVVFTSPYDRTTRGRFWPQYTVRHPLPENRKSQFIYLRPDLGTTVYPYQDLHRLAYRLDIDLSERANSTSHLNMHICLSRKAASYIEEMFPWDVEQTRSLEECCQ